MRILEQFLCILNDITRPFFGGKVPDFPTCTVVKMPPQNNQIEFGEMYLVTSATGPKWLLFQCPCRCGHVVTLALAAGKSPRWNVVLSKKTRLPSLRPSVRQLSGCLSHYWIQHGKVIWCEDTGQKEHFDF